MEFQRRQCEWRGCMERIRTFTWGRFFPQIFFAPLSSRFHSFFSPPPYYAARRRRREINNKKILPAINMSEPRFISHSLLRNEWAKEFFSPLKACWMNFFAYRHFTIHWNSSKRERERVRAHAYTLHIWDNLCYYSIIPTSAFSYALSLSLTHTHDHIQCAIFHKRNILFMLPLHVLLIFAFENYLSPCYSPHHIMLQRGKTQEKEREREIERRNEEKKTFPFGPQLSISLSIHPPLYVVFRNVIFMWKSRREQ